MRAFVRSVQAGHITRSVMRTASMAEHELDAVSGGMQPCTSSFAIFVFCLSVFGTFVVNVADRARCETRLPCLLEEEGKLRRSAMSTMTITLMLCFLGVELAFT